jgi:HSP20 family protein
MASIYDFEFPFFGIWSPFFEEGQRPRRPSSHGGLNLHESKGDIVVEVAVPGAKKDEISLEIKEGIIRIDADHQESKEDKKEKETVYRSQMQSSFHYAVTLPKPVEEDKAKAKLENGILKITIPTAKEAKKSKGITIEEEKDK